MQTIGRWASFGDALFEAAEEPAASGFGFDAPSCKGGFGVDASFGSLFGPPSVAARVSGSPPQQPWPAAFGGPFGPPSGSDNPVSQMQGPMQANDALAALRGKMINVKRSNGAIEPGWELASDARVDGEGKVEVFKRDPQKGDLTRSTLLQELLSINGVGSASLSLGDFGNASAAVAPNGGFGERGWGFGAPSSEGGLGFEDAFGGSSLGLPSAAILASAPAQQAPPAPSCPPVPLSCYPPEPTDDMTDQCPSPPSSPPFLHRVILSPPVLLSHHQLSSSRVRPPM
jgi:hypothetical protein